MPAPTRCTVAASGVKALSSSRSILAYDDVVRQEITIVVRASSKANRDRQGLYVRLAQV